MAEYTPKHRADEQDLLGLSLSISKLEMRAHQLGMMAAHTFYSVDMADGSKVWVSGSPIELRGSNEQQFLCLIVNRVTEPHRDAEGIGHIFVEEHIVGNGAISSELAMIRLDENGDFDERVPKLPPVVWMMDNDELGVLRGRQWYTVPEIPTSHERLEYQHFMSDTLTNYVLGLLTPGTYDAQYPAG